MIWPGFRSITLLSEEQTIERQGQRKGDWSGGSFGNPGRR